MWPLEYGTENYFCVLYNKTLNGIYELHFLESSTDTHKQTFTKKEKKTRDSIMRKYSAVRHILGIAELF